MVETLATIMSHFAGEANRARCLAHIVNLVAKIILRQFDQSKGKKKKEDNVVPIIDGEDNQIEDEDLDASEVDEGEERELDREEKEMDDGDDDEDDEDTQMIERDVEIMEAAMEEEIKNAVKKAKPVRQVLYKVSLNYVASFFLAFDPARFFYNL